MNLIRVVLFLPLVFLALGLIYLAARLGGPIVVNALDEGFRKYGNPA